LECAFGVVGKILMSRIYWNLFGKIWIQNVGDIDFKVISAAENSNKLKKPRFWKEKSVENVVTLEGLPFNSSMITFHIWPVQKIDTYIAKQCSHVELPYFVMGSHLGQMAHTTLVWD
jgi:hypothetical protein